MKAHPPLRSGTLAKLVGVSPDTLRLYERKGLLPKPLRTANGYRCYSSQSARRVRLIRSALAIGFTLDELAQMLKIRDAGGAPCRKVRELAASKLQALNHQIQNLMALRAQLRKVVRDWDRLLEQTPQHTQARLLEALADAPEKLRALPRHFYAMVTKEPRK